MPYKNKVEQKAAQRKWYENNKALTRERSRAWKKKNRKKVNASEKKYRDNNRDKIRARQSRYEKEQTAKLTTYYIIQELKKYGIPSKFSRENTALVDIMKAYYGLVRLTKKKSDGKKQVTLHTGKQLHRLLKRY